MISETVRLAILTLAKGGKLQTRLQEMPDGDREFMQHGVPPEVSIDENTFIRFLYILEEQGVLSVTIVPHLYDPSEYILTWSPTSEA